MLRRRLMLLIFSGIYIVSANAQVKKAKTWAVISDLFKSEISALTPVLAPYKFEPGRDSLTGSKGWKSYIDRRTLYMDPGGSMMYDSLLVYVENRKISIVSFMFGNDNGDARLPEQDLKKFEADLIRQGFTRKIEKKNEYAERRIYLNETLRLRVDADLWIHDGLPLLIRMRVAADGDTSIPDRYKVRP